MFTIFTLCYAPLDAIFKAIIIVGVFSLISALVVGLPVNYVGCKKNMKECLTITASMIICVDEGGIFCTFVEDVTQIKFTL